METYGGSPASSLKRVATDANSARTTRRIWPNRHAPVIESPHGRVSDNHPGVSALAQTDQRAPYRTLFISDLHLGLKAAQAEAVLDFLKVHDAETIYLVGDIVDGWALKGNWHWPQSHNDVAQKLLRKARKGTRIYYLPGNHDEFLRDFYGTHFGGIEVVESALHEAADGKRYLVIHGDQFDFAIRHAKWLAHLGDAAYDLALFLNRWLAKFRRKLGLPYWSLSAWAKMKVKNAVNVISRFEDELAKEAQRLNAQGVICGHIHTAAHRSIGPVTYLNTGDWVESLTGIVEHHDGRMELIQWREKLGERVLEQQQGQLANIIPYRRPEPVWVPAIPMS
jgi:UDP-2,3-diacylglucosamine pyrophosphatase LpxH